MKKIVILLFVVIMSVAAMQASGVKEAPKTPATVKTVVADLSKESQKEEPKEDTDPAKILKGDAVDKAVAPMLGDWTALMCQKDGSAATMEIVVSLNSKKHEADVTFGVLNTEAGNIVKSTAGTYHSISFTNHKYFGLGFAVDAAKWDALLFMNTALKNSGPITNIRLVGKIDVADENGDFAIYVISVKKSAATADFNKFLSDHKAVCKDDKAFHYFAHGDID